MLNCYGKIDIAYNKQNLSLHVLVYSINDVINASRRPPNGSKHSWQSRLAAVKLVKYLGDTATTIFFTSTEILLLLEQTAHTTFMWTLEINLCHVTLHVNTLRSTEKIMLVIQVLFCPHAERNHQTTFTVSTDSSQNFLLRSTHKSFTAIQKIVVYTTTAFNWFYTRPIRHHFFLYRVPVSQSMQHAVLRNSIQSLTIESLNISHHSPL